MTEQGNYWRELFTEYKKSGLKRLDFCQKNDISHSQFRYQWNKQHQAARRALKLTPLHAAESLFEPVVVTKLTERMVANKIVELTVHLPNKIRCDLKIDMSSHDFSALLQQLVAVC
jgi:hypothetical protein